MKERLIVIMFFLSPAIILAQENRFAGIPSDDVIRDYMTDAKEYAALFTGKVEIPYDKRFTNHPYFETDIFQSGTLGYNHVVYKDVMMRFDLFRNELTIFSPDKPYYIVLNNEKFDFAILNGSTIVLSDSEKEAKRQFLVLLQNGQYPVLKKYIMAMEDEISSMQIINYFRIKSQCAIYKDGIPYTVKNKNSILKLFPDKRKELDAFAKQRKLDFNRQIEQSIIALVNHYENLTNQ